MSRTLKIDLYADIVCPWCLIGEQRLDNVLKREFGDIAVDIEHHPVLLMPDCPPGGIRTMDLLRSRYGEFDPKDFWARPEEEARKAGLDLDLSRQTMFYPTTDAQTLIRHARSRGTQHALATALTRAYFLDARDISDREVLTDIAESHGFARDETQGLLESQTEKDATRHAAAAASTRGIRSVPTFVINGKAVQPQDAAALAAHLRDALPGKAVD